MAWKSLLAIAWRSWPNGPVPLPQAVHEAIAKVKAMAEEARAQEYGRLWQQIGAILDSMLRSKRLVVLRVRRAQGAGAR